MAEAGAHGAITVSTQMAGPRHRHPARRPRAATTEVAALGGLQVIGTGRHASSRLDDQLRGRSGRQGDPGGSVFFVSMEDELITTCVRTPTRLVTYADRRPRRRPRGALDGGPRPAGGRGRQPGDPPQHLAVQHAPRGPAAPGARAPRPAAAHRRGAAGARPALPGAVRRSSAPTAGPRRCSTRPPGRSSCPTSTRPGRTTSPRWPSIREGIHLRALGRGLNPLGEFHREAVTAVHRLLRDVEARSAHTFQTVTITADGADLEAAGLKRPTATWTYLVQDNPFGTDIDRALRDAGRLLGRSRR